MLILKFEKRKDIIVKKCLKNKQRRTVQRGNLGDDLEAEPTSENRDIHMESYSGCPSMRNNLQTKGVHCLVTCVFCSSALENCCHWFLTCPVSMECWKHL